MSDEEQKKFPHKNVITRALGMRDTVQVDVSTEDIRDGDLFLLCSDGLTGMVDEKRIREMLKGAPDLEGAVTGYRQFLKLHPEATPIHSNLGAALAGLGRFEEAISEYKIALKQSPKLPGTRLNLALAYYKMGRIRDAAAQLEKVHDEDPANHQAILLLGDCYLRMERNKDVIRVLVTIPSRDLRDIAGGSRSAPRRTKC